MRLFIQPHSSTSCLNTIQETMNTIVCNTIMCILNFINAMPCMCARLPSFGASHFGRLLLSIFGASSYLIIIFLFRLFKMAVSQRDIAEVPSLGIFFIRSWLFGELKTKAYAERCSPPHLGRASYICQTTWPCPCDG